jgi:hypothetical protein
MMISYVEMPFKVKEDLNIDPEIGFEVSKKVQQLFETEYVRGGGQMTRNLNHRW